MKQVQRFVVVGTSNTVFTYLIYIALNFVMAYWIAFTVSFAAGILFSAALNSRYSFGVSLKVRAIVRFALFCFVSYGVSLQLVIFLVERLAIHEALAPLIVVVALLPLTFLGSRAALTGQLRGP